MFPRFDGYRNLPTPNLGAGDNADDLKACGELLVRTYMDQAAPSVEPTAIELHVAGEIDGVSVQGYVDVLDVHGDVVDVKTATWTMRYGM
jgi:hypothetical protein